MTDDSRSEEFYDDPDSAVTINDVAQAAGVSVSTVSRILNGRPDVAARTRSRVLRVIEELGYTPHVSAQSLAARRSRTISLVFPFEYVGLTQLELDFFVGAASAVEAQNYFLNLMTKPTPPERLAHLYKSRQVEGVILMQVQMQDARVDTLREKNYPFVMIGRCEENDGLSFVDLDFEAAVAMAFDHLYGLGHRDIGFITRPVLMRERNIASVVRLLRGYLHACDQHSITPAYREPNLDYDSVYAAALDLLREHPQTTAIIGTFGAASVPIIRAAQSIGRRVPEDLSLVAIATNRVASMVTPPLTAINFPLDRMGYLAAENLLNMLQDPSRPPDQMLLAPELMIRETTYPVKKTRK